MDGYFREAQKMNILIIVDEKMLIRKSMNMWPAISVIPLFPQPSLAQQPTCWPNSRCWVSLAASACIKACMARFTCNASSSWQRSIWLAETFYLKNYVIYVFYVDVHGFYLIVLSIPVVPHKVVAEVSKIYRRGELL
jgi:hypothetical protein